jgi:integrase/ferredoxin
MAKGYEKKRTRKGWRYYPYVDWKGQRYRAGRGFETKAEANPWASEKYTELVNQQAAQDEPTLDELCDAYIIYNENRKINENTLRSYSYITKLVFWRMGDDLLVRDIRPDQLDVVISWLHEYYSLKSATRIVMGVRSLFRFAIDREYIDKSPASKLNMRSGGPGFKVLTKNELYRMVCTSDDPRDRAIIALGGSAGLRIGEFFGLTWRDLDLKMETISIRREMVKRVGGPQPAPLKTRASYKTLPIQSELVDILKAWKWVAPSSPWLFPSTKKGNLPISPDSWSYWFFTRIKREAGVDEDFTFQDLRHTFITLLLESGVDLAYAQELARHANIPMTRAYAHISQRHLRDVVRQARFFDNLSNEMSNKTDEELSKNNVIPFPKDNKAGRPRDNTGFIYRKPLGGGLLRDAELCIRFLMQYEGIVPDPGIERIEEMRQILRAAGDPRPLSPGEEERMERIRRVLGDRWSHRCEYCQPCPLGIQISPVLVAESVARRMSRDTAVSFIGPVMEKAAECTGCGRCVERCPYGLDIPALLRGNLSAWECYRRTGAWPDGAAG